MNRLLIAFSMLALCTACSSSDNNAGQKELQGSRWNSVRSNVAMRSARVHVAEGNYAAAKRELDTALQLGADTPRLRLMLARLAIEEGRYREARVHLDRTDALKPGLGETSMVRALMAEVQGRWPDAAAAYRVAVARAPRNDRARLGEVRALRASGRDGEARIAMSEHLRARPASSELLAAAAEDALHSGEANRAVEYLDRSVRLGTPNRDTQIARGLALHRGGQHAAAIEALSPHVGEGASKEVRMALARSATMLNRYDLSIRTLQGLVADDAGDANGWYELAAAYFLTDRPQLTLEALREALALRPRYREAIELLGHLRLDAGQFNHALAAYHMALDLGASPEALGPVIQIARAGRTERTEQRRLPITRRKHVASTGHARAVPPPPPPPPLHPGS